MNKHVGSCLHCCILYGSSGKRATRPCRADRLSTTRFQWVRDSSPTTLENLFSFYKKQEGEAQGPDRLREWGLKGPPLFPFFFWRVFLLGPRFFGRGRGRGGTGAGRGRWLWWARPGAAAAASQGAAPRLDSRARSTLARRAPLTSCLGPRPHPFHGPRNGPPPGRAPVYNSSPDHGRFDAI